MQNIRAIWLSQSHCNTARISIFSNMLMDTFVIMEAYPSQMLFLKFLLQNFSTFTCLKVNFAKSMLLPINLEEDGTAQLAQLFGCVVGTLPFTYLGLPLGWTKPEVIDFLPLVTRCQRHLAFTSPFLFQAGRLEVTNSIFTSLPMFLERCRCSWYIES